MANFQFTDPNEGGGPPGEGGGGSSGDDPGGSSSGPSSGSSGDSSGGSQVGSSGGTPGGSSGGPPGDSSGGPPSGISGGGGGDYEEPDPPLSTCRGVSLHCAYNIFNKMSKDDYKQVNNLISYIN